MKTIDELMDGLEVLETRGDMNTGVSSVCCDSRKAVAGSLFVCLPGSRVDGHSFIRNALASGAVAVICESEAGTDIPAPVVRVRDTRIALAAISASFYDHPASKLKLIGITGTNGKTTTSLLLESILRHAGYKPGVLGTLSYRWAGREIPASMTTPESLDLQRILHEMLGDGVTHVVMEVSSHSLVLGRVAGLTFRVGVFTNLSQDHLDFHKTMGEYFLAKRLLFSSYLDPQSSTAVINADDAYGMKLLENGACRARAVGYSAKISPCVSRPCGANPPEKGDNSDRISREAEQLNAAASGMRDRNCVFTESVHFGPDGISARVATPRGCVDIRSPLVGRLNLYNILAAVSAGGSLDVPLDAIAAGIGSVSEVDGRLQRVPVPESFGCSVIVDYAHTPDAMEKALSCLREMTAGRLIAVFGCGGDRDNGKRPLMGEIAARCADIVVLTSDNPRTEDPEKILDQIEAGLGGLNIRRGVNGSLPGEKWYARISDRRKAIEFGLAAARPGDLLFIGGKGHETYQIIGYTKHSFDDRLVVGEYFQKTPVLKARKMFWTPAILAEAAGGELLSGNPDAPIETISTDTRKMAARHCFIALSGENHDGHAFVADAIGKGAGAVIVSEWQGGAAPANCAVIQVRDTLHALGEIARFHRNRFDIPVIAISGSNGKTSTKEMIAAIFERSRRVLKNKGNYNNLIGLPLTLLELTGEHQMAVVEMGINVPGEMERLARIGSPDAGVITNVQPAHLQGLGSLDGIAEEKGQLWRGLRPGGLAVVNLDDPRLSKYAEGVSARKVTYSCVNPAADIHAIGEVTVSEGMTRFSISIGGTGVPVCLPIIGLHHARNALAAAATAYGMGASVEEIAVGLAGYEPANQRMQCIPLRNGCVVVDDSYNANPGSLLAAVEAVRVACSGRPFVAVLGEMRELGPESPGLHFDVGKRIGTAKPSRLVTLGELGLELERGAREAGMEASACFHAHSHEEALSYLRRNLPERAWILVKGSRAMAMEQIVEGMTEGNEEGVRED